jgi:hypothetical protein
VRRRYSFVASRSHRCLRDCGGALVTCFTLLTTLASGPSAIFLLMLLPVWRRCLARLDPEGATLLFCAPGDWQLLRPPPAAAGQAGSAGGKGRPGRVLRCLARPGGALWLRYGADCNLLVFADSLDDQQWRDLRHTLRIYAAESGA